MDIKNPWLKLDIILSLLVIASVFCLIFMVAQRAIFDPDIWLHLKTGEYILQNRNIPSIDIFSFTVRGKPWLDHEWLFQLVSYLIYNKWSFDGLIALQTYIIILSFIILLLMGYEGLKSHLTEVAIFIFVAAYTSWRRFNIRPDIFSLFFFAFYLYLLRFHLDKKRVWLLLPIQVLWVNFHGYFFLGPLLILLFIIAEFLRRQIKNLAWGWKDEFALSDAVYNRLKKLFFLSLLAGFLNPNGFKGALYPFFIFKGLLTGKTQIFFRYIQELQPTLSIVKYTDKFYLITVISCLALMSINFKRLKIIEIIIFPLFFLFSLTLRNIAFFSFVSYMIIISYIVPTVKTISENIQLVTAFRQKLYFLFKYTAAILIIVWLWAKVNTVIRSSYYYDFDTKKFRSRFFGIEDKRYPKGAVDFILENDLPPYMFNDFNSGSYLIGRAYPERKVFIDGRTELYGPDFFQQYQKLMEGDSPIFEKTVEKYNLSAILLSMTSTSMPKIITYIYKSPQWKLVYLDDTAVVFLKDASSNQGLIKKYKIDLNSYLVPKADFIALGIKRIYPQPYIKRAALFNLLKEDDLVIQETKEALKIMPNCFEAYQLQGKSYLRKKLYPEAYENFRAALLLIPNNVEALVDLGKCLKELKENNYAIKTFQGAIKINPHYAPAYFQLACIFLIAQDETKAIENLNKAIKYAPKSATYHLKLGEVLYEKAKRLKDNSLVMQAKKELNTALGLASQDEELRKEIEEKLKAAGGKL